VISKENLNGSTSHKVIFSGGSKMSEDLIINRAIIKETTSQVGIEEVWKAWTTRDGIQSFFAPECHVAKRGDT